MILSNQIRTTLHVMKRQFGNQIHKRHFMNHKETINFCKKHSTYNNDQMIKIAKNIPNLIAFHTVRSRHHDSVIDFVADSPQVFLLSLNDYRTLESDFSNYVVMNPNHMLDIYKDKLIAVNKVIRAFRDNHPRVKSIFFPAIININNEQQLETIVQYGYDSNYFSNLTAVRKRLLHLIRVKIIILKKIKNCKRDINKGFNLMLYCQYGNNYRYPSLYNIGFYQLLMKMEQDGKHPLQAMKIVSDINNHS